MLIVNNRANDMINKLHNVKTSLVLDKSEVMVVHITLEAGEQLRPHITPVEVFFYILEGECTVQVGDEKRKVSKDNLVESPANIVHCLYNETDEPVRVLVVKTPKPTTSSKML